MQVAILGRQSKISLAELESLFGAENITSISYYAALVKSDTPLPQEKLGGTIKSSTVITTLKNADANSAFAFIQETIVAYADEKIFEGKIQLGFSLYGFKAQKNWLLKKTLEVKKVLKKSGRSVRIIENKAEALEAAQVLYNKLTGSQGIEYLIIKDGNNVILAQTTAVQNIDDYAARDHGRPMRDAFVGMLPPKLAQIMINLAKPTPGATILDPFCGTGVVLQEAMLMKHPVYGTDLSEKMIRYSRENLNWLQDKEFLKSSWYLEVADAMSHTWRQPIDSVICETYLGKPLTSLPKEQDLSNIVNQAQTIAAGFLENIVHQISPNSKLCVALPVWHTKNGDFRHLPVVNDLENIGYKRKTFDLASQEDLIYHRDGQVVGRELLVLEKN